MCVCVCVCLYRGLLWIVRNPVIKSIVKSRKEIGKGECGKEGWRQRETRDNTKGCACVCLCVCLPCLTQPMYQGTLILKSTIIGLARIIYNIVSVTTTSE